MRRDPVHSARSARASALAEQVLACPDTGHLDRLIDDAAAALSVDNLTLSLMDEEAIALGTGGPRPLRPVRGDRTPFADTICATALRATGPIVIEDARCDARVSSVPAVADGSVRAYLGVPLVIDGCTVAVLCATEANPRRWAAADLVGLSESAALVSAELQRLQLLATSDEATSDEATSDEATSDEATSDEAASDEATDQAASDPLGTVLVTGAGGAAAVTVLRSLAGQAELVAADIDPVAVGLYLAAPDRRLLLPRGDDPGFVDALLAAAIDTGATLVVPTVDTELLPVSAARDRFAEHGIDVLVESPATLETCLDKYVLMGRCAGAVRVPRTVLVDASVDDAELALLGRPFIVKPRRGAGGRGFAVIDTPAAAQALPRDGSLIAQELLPGDEYSIDVLARPGGGVVAAVPRRRDKVDSGVAVAGRTVADAALVEFATRVATVVGAQTVINVQAKLDTDGRPALLEVNARFPGTMTLTQAAGVDMPLLAVQAARGRTLPEHVDFAEVAVVRHWTDVVVPVAEYGTMTRPAVREPVAGGV